MSLRSVLITAAIVVVILLLGAFLTSRGMNPLDRLAARPAGSTAPTGAETDTGN